MNVTYESVVREKILPHAGRVMKRGNSYMVECSSHEDRTPSVSISPGRDQPVLIICRAGCDPGAVLAGWGLTWADLSKPRDTASSARGDDTWMPCAFDDDRKPIAGHGKIAEYLYRDQEGATIFGVARCKGKGSVCQGFRQWRPDTTKRSGRSWSLTLPDGTKVGEGLPYRLPELLRAIELGQNVWVCGGEKDVERARSLGYAATCNAGGETTDGQGRSKWTAAHADWLAGADVIIVADRDPTGRRWAEAVVATLLPLARSVEVKQAAIGNDLSDHLDAHGQVVADHLRTVGRDHLDAHGQPITRLGIHHLIKVADPILAPTAVPGCPDPCCVVAA